MPLPALVPLIGAALTLAAGRKLRLQRAIALVALDRRAHRVGRTDLSDRPPGNTGAASRWLGSHFRGARSAGHNACGGSASALMLVVSAIVPVGRRLLRHRQGIRDGDDRQPVSIFLPTYLVLSAGVHRVPRRRFVQPVRRVRGSAVREFRVADDRCEQGAVRAGISYVMVSMVSSLIFLIGLALIYAAAGTLNMAELSVRLMDVSEGTRSAPFAVLLVAFGIKAAVFPLDVVARLLPSPHPRQTAVFAGLLTKVGVYAIIRAHSLLFPAAAWTRCCWWRRS